MLLENAGDDRLVEEEENVPMIRYKYHSGLAIAMNMLIAFHEETHL